MRKKKKYIEIQMRRCREEENIMALKNQKEFFFRGKSTTLKEGDQIRFAGYLLIIERKKGEDVLPVSGSKDGRIEFAAPWLERADRPEVEAFMFFLAASHGLAVVFVDTDNKADMRFRLVKR